MGEGPASEALALGQGRAAEGHGRDHLGITAGRDHDRDVGMILGGGAHHRRPADIDLLDGVVAGHTGGDRLDERIEVHHDELERADAKVNELRLMAGEPTVGQDASVDGGMQGLHASVEGLLESGDARDLGDRISGIRDRSRGRAGGDDFHPGVRERGRELE